MPFATTSNAPFRSDITSITIRFYSSVLRLHFGWSAGGLKCRVVEFATLTDVYWHASCEACADDHDAGGAGTSLLLEQG